MKKIILITTFTLVICLTQCAEVPPPEPKPDPHTTTTQQPITTKAPIPHTTNPPTISPPTTTTSIPPKTSTLPPTTSTLPPTTSTLPPTTSTLPPTTSTAPSTIPTKPTKKPKPETGLWSVNYNGTNTTCIVLKVALQMEIPYTSVDNKFENATIIVPPTANATGNCEKNKTTQSITIYWLMNNDTNLKDSVTFNFEKNDTIKKFMLTSIEAQLTPDQTNFPNMKSNATFTASLTKKEFLTPLKMSYRCKPKELFNLTVSGNTELGQLIISDLQMEAFHDKHGTSFDSSKDCQASETPGIVPIAVGCSLAALIIIVLIAYLVGRRRSMARGYLSMFSEKQREAEYIPMKNISCFGK